MHLWILGQQHFNFWAAAFEILCILERNNQKQKNKKRGSKTNGPNKQTGTSKREQTMQKWASTDSNRLPYHPIKQSLTPWLIASDHRWEFKFCFFGGGGDGGGGEVGFFQWTNELLVKKSQNLKKKN